MARMLSAGRTKVTLLTAAPADPGAPTVAELNGGLDISPLIPRSLFNWTTAEPNKESDTALSAQFETQVPIEKTYDLKFGLYRSFDEVSGGFDATEEAAFEAVKEMSSTVWVYARRTDKLSGDAWAAADEIYLGGEVTSDGARLVHDGYQKYEIGFSPVDMYEFIAAAA